MLDAVENGRIRELGFSRIAGILLALRLETKLLDASQGSSSRHPVPKCEGPVAPLSG